jgi:hypothetical protein
MDNLTEKVQDIKLENKKQKKVHIFTLAPTTRLSFRTYTYHNLV